MGYGISIWDINMDIDMGYRDGISIWDIDMEVDIRCRYGMWDIDMVILDTDMGYMMSI